jgi:dTDP-4-amino-4,6-dideoxygalactose transaminase
MKNNNIISYENLFFLNINLLKKFSSNLNNPKKINQYILGSNVISFEKNFSNFISSKKNLFNSIGVASGLDALQLSLMSLNFKKGSEVIVPANTYVASILAIINVGLKPVLVEPDIDTYNIDYKKIEEKINKNTVAIMVTHLYGKSCDMKEIVSICKKNNLKLIEDCAQSIGSEYFGKKTGAFGDLSCFSFYPTKQLGALGDGGLVCTRFKKLEKIIRSLRNYGSIKRYKNELIGVNSRLDEIQANFLLLKFKFLNKIINKKIHLANIYFKNLDKNKYILPTRKNGFKDTFYIFNIRSKFRDKIRGILLKKNIYTDIHYPTPPHKQKAFKNIFKKEKFPISEKIHRTTLSLPISYIHSDKDILRVCDIMNKIDL